MDVAEDPPEDQRAEGDEADGEVASAEDQAHQVLQDEVRDVRRGARAGREERRPREQAARDQDPAQEAQQVDRAEQREPGRRARPVVAPRGERAAGEEASRRGGRDGGGARAAGKRPGRRREKLRHGAVRRAAAQREGEAQQRELPEEQRERRELQPDRGREGLQGAAVDVDADGVDAAEEDLRLPAEHDGERRADREREQEQDPRRRLFRKTRREALQARHGTEQRRPDAVHEQVVEAVLDEAGGQVDPAEEEDEGQNRRHAARKGYERATRGRLSIRSYIEM